MIAAIRLRTRAVHVRDAEGLLPSEGAFGKYGEEFEVLTKITRPKYLHSETSELGRFSAQYKPIPVYLKTSLW
jgi:hypothetical protein